LNKIEEIDLKAKDPEEKTIICNEQCDSQCDQQCVQQKSIMDEIFKHFEIPTENNKHSCFYKGVNCTGDGFVTDIWFVNRGFVNKTIPDLFHKLKSLKALLLGENNLMGSIPPSLGKGFLPLQLLWLRKCLWNYNETEDNKLTGTIPARLANFRGLRELNLRGNQFHGTFPTRFLNILNNLDLLNLGRNNLSGPIPISYGLPSPIRPTPPSDSDVLGPPLDDIVNCKFRFQKETLDWLGKSAIQSPSLTIISLCKSVIEWRNYYRIGKTQLFDKYQYQ